jgi:uncharacterized membrane protein YtjA (UPF0391 family)
MRFEANLNMDLQTEQRKQLGQPGSGSNMFKIELPTSGQIYRFNKTVIEGEEVNVTFYYASNTVITLIKIFLILVVLILIYGLRKKIAALIRRIYHWIAKRKAIWDFLKTRSGMRTALFVASVFAWWISKILFTVLVLLFLLSIFRPQWLLPAAMPPKAKSEEEKEKD